MFGIDIFGAVAQVFGPLAAAVTGFIKFVVFTTLFSIALFLLVFFALYRFNPLRLTPAKLRAPYIRFKWYNLLRWVLVDFLERGQHRGEFRDYGFTFFCGRQGAGKTSAMVRYLEMMRLKHPGCIIVANFKCEVADYLMRDWRDIVNVRNGTAGVIFAIDEIQSEYNTANWKDVPEDLLREVAMQRKQRVKIVATSQFFGRVAKPLREQASTVVVCSTYLGRLTCTREYDALDYAAYLDNPNAVRKKLRPLHKQSFVQSDDFRALFDTYEKIERMKQMRPLPRDKRCAV